MELVESESPPYQAELVCLVGPDPDVLWFEGAETVWSRCRLVSAVHSFWRHSWSFCTSLFMTLRTPLCVEWMRVYDFLWRPNEESGFSANSDGKEAAPIFAGSGEEKVQEILNLKKKKKAKPTSLTQEEGVWPQNNKTLTWSVYTILNQ